jgi:hypothetical protein
VGKFYNGIGGENVLLGLRVVHSGLCQTCIDKMYDHRASQLVLAAVNLNGTRQSPFQTDCSYRAELLARGNNVGLYHAKRMWKPVDRLIHSAAADVRLLVTEEV